MNHNYFSTVGPNSVRLHYTFWQAAANSPLPVCCVHGLTRNCRDFDWLAATLSNCADIYCLDVAGRGQSDHYGNPDCYNYGQYVADCSQWLDRLGPARVHWVGTSMGGIIGMMLAAQPRSPIASLVLNDIGIHIPASALTRIASYVGRSSGFRTFEQARDHLMEIHAGFGNLTPSQWNHLTRHSIKRNAEGYRLVYDPAIGQALSGPVEDIDLSTLWQGVRCPVLVLRGENSDILSRQTAEKMRRNHGGAEFEITEFADCAHAPALADPVQISAVASWLLRQQRPEKDC